MKRVNSAARAEHAFILPQSSDTYRRSEPPNLKQPVVDHRKQHPAAVATDLRKPARSCSKHVEARLNLSSFRPLPSISTLIVAVSTSACFYGPKHPTPVEI
jgi:hypothetical protein